MTSRPNRPRARKTPVTGALVPLGTGEGSSPRAHCQSKYLKVVLELRGQGRLALGQRRRRVLVPLKNRGEPGATRVPGGKHGGRDPAGGLAKRVALVDHRALGGPNGQEHVEGQADHDQGERAHPQVAAQKHPRGRHEQHQAQGRHGQKRHGVVGPAQDHQVARHQQEAPAPGFAAPVAPAHRQPGHRGDHQHADRVDLLVDHGLVPHGIRRGAQQRARRRPHQRPPVVAQQPPRDAVGHQEEEPARGGGSERGQQVHPHRDRQPQRRQQNDPHSRQHHEEGVSRRVRDPEDVSGRDVLARVPERRGGSQRDDVQEEDRRGGDDGGEVGRAVLVHLNGPGIRGQLPGTSKPSLVSTVAPDSRSVSLRRSE